MLVHIARFRCNTDCKNDPENCIGERLFRAMGDMLVVGGFQVVIDNREDGWNGDEEDDVGTILNYGVLFLQWGTCWSLAGFR